MADNKKSFVIYCDLIDAIDHLTTLEKGKLFEHLLDYVNDKNPVMEDRILLGTWKHIEQSLKRDLKKYEARADRSRENGKLGGRPPKNPEEPIGLISNPEKPKKPVSDTDTVTVIDTGTGNVKDTKEDRKKKFKTKVLTHSKEFNSKTLKDFFEYWTESGENQTKLRFEFEKVFDIHRRLRTWNKRENKSGFTKPVSPHHNVLPNANYDEKF